MTIDEARTILRLCQHLHLPKPVRRPALRGGEQYELHWSHSRMRAVIFDYQAARYLVACLRQDMKVRS